MSAAERLPGALRGSGPRGESSARVVGLADGPLGTYVHVPFCARVCPFCPYNKVVPRVGQPERYFEALIGRFRAQGVTRVRTLVDRRDNLILSFFRAQGMVAGPSLQLDMELPQGQAARI